MRNLNNSIAKFLIQKWMKDMNRPVQDLALTRQAFYHFSYIPTLF
jgi:hypothetical protein